MVILHMFFFKECQSEEIFEKACIWCNSHLGVYRELTSQNETSEINVSSLSICSYRIIVTNHVSDVIKMYI